MEAQNSAGNHSSFPPNSRANEEDKKPDDTKDQNATPFDFENTISTLPQDSGWIADVPLYQYKGFWYPAYFLKGVMAFAQDESSSSKLFEFHQSDIILCSSAKTGTTWLKALVYSIATRTRSFFSHGNTLINSNVTASASTNLPQCETATNPLMKWVSHDLIPFLEVDIAQHQKPRNPDLPIFSTHMSYTSLPRSITTLGCKIIYIWRDPKDTFISTWHFNNRVMNSLKREGTPPISMEKAFDLFSRGIATTCPYWDHVLEYWKASQCFPDRVLFLKYEDMMEDTSCFYIKKIADFMDCPFSTEEESQGGVVEKIWNFCSYESLSQLDVNKTGMHRQDEPYPMENNIYFRKGKTGDWKNYLTVEMEHKLDAITREKFGNTGLIL